MNEFENNLDMIGDSDDIPDQFNPDESESMSKGPSSEEPYDSDVRTRELSDKDEIKAERAACARHEYLVEDMMSFPGVVKMCVHIFFGIAAWKDFSFDLSWSSR